MATKTLELAQIQRMHRMSNRELDATNSQEKSQLLVLPLCFCLSAWTERRTLPNGQLETALREALHRGSGIRNLERSGWENLVGLQRRVCCSKVTDSTDGERLVDGSSELFFALMR